MSDSKYRFIPLLLGLLSLLPWRFAWAEDEVVIGEGTSIIGMGLASPHSVYVRLKPNETLEVCSSDAWDSWQSTSAYQAYDDNCGALETATLPNNKLADACAPYIIASTRIADPLNPNSQAAILIYSADNEIGCKSSAECTHSTFNSCHDKKTGLPVDKLLDKSDSVCMKKLAVSQSLMKNYCDSKERSFSDKLRAEQLSVNGGVFVINFMGLPYTQAGTLTGKQYYSNVTDYFGIVVKNYDLQPQTGRVQTGRVFAKKWNFMQRNTLPEIAEKSLYVAVTDDAYSSTASSLYQIKNSQNLKFLTENPTYYWTLFANDHGVNEVNEDIEGEYLSKSWCLNGQRGMFNGSPYGCDTFAEAHRELCLNHESVMNSQNTESLSCRTAPGSMSHPQSLEQYPIYLSEPDLTLQPVSAASEGGSSEEQGEQQPENCKNENCMIRFEDEAGSNTISSNGDGVQDFGEFRIACKEPGRYRLWVGSAKSQNAGNAAEPGSTAAESNTVPEFRMKELTWMGDVFDISQTPESGKLTEAQRLALAEDEKYKTLIADGYSYVSLPVEWPVLSHLDDGETMRNKEETGNYAFEIQKFSKEIHIVMNFAGVKSGPLFSVNPVKTALRNIQLFWDDTIPDTKQSTPEELAKVDSPAGGMSVRSIASLANLENVVLDTWFVEDELEPLTSAIYQKHSCVLDHPEPEICAQFIEVSSSACLAGTGCVFDEDSDGDGLSDIFEKEYNKQNPSESIDTNLSHLKCDSDGDGLNDGVELGMQHIKCPASESGSSGGDLLVESLEAYCTQRTQGANTDPRLFSSDGDGLPDGQECCLLQLNASGEYEVCENTITASNCFCYWGASYKELEEDSNIGNLQIPRIDSKEEVTFLTCTNPNASDTDGDSLNDNEEIGKVFTLCDADFLYCKTDPNLKDTDGDGLNDGLELGYGIDGLHNLTEPLLRDTDGDGIWDGDEDVNRNGVCDRDETCADKWDTDGDGLSDAFELWQSHTSPLLFDTDGDGLGDGLELGMRLDDTGQLSHLISPDAILTNPLLPDTDGDGIPDGIEDTNHNGIQDKGETDPRKLDTDGDGISDGLEDFNQNGIRDYIHDRTGAIVLLKCGNDNNVAPCDCVADECLCIDADCSNITTKCRCEMDPLNRDTDEDGLIDGFEDANHNGIWEKWLGETNPLDADSDGDELSDLAEVTLLDHLCQSTECTKSCPNPNLADTDGDGIPDGTEILQAIFEKYREGKDILDDEMLLLWEAEPIPEGLTPELSQLLFYRSNPCLRDTDGDGLEDGEEDANKNGICDLETHEERSCAYLADTDGGGENDGDEIASGRDPYNKLDDKTDSLDTDGDGLLDEYEKENFLNPYITDTDGDGLEDGVEAGARVEIKDSSSKTVTIINYYCVLTEEQEAALEQGQNQVGLKDQQDVPIVRCATKEEREEARQKGRFSFTDPLQQDTDKDGLYDGYEFCVKKPADDEDSAPKAQSECSGTDPNNPDSDGDGLNDNIELGIRVMKGLYTFEPISNKNPTNPMIADSDCDGLLDGEEDANHNGVLDSGETNPNASDSDCDGLSDYIELHLTDYIHGLKTGTDPNQADSDGDGLFDGEEICLDESSIVVTPDVPEEFLYSQAKCQSLAEDQVCENAHEFLAKCTNTNPLNVDTDGGGQSDGDEVKVGSDPNDAEDDVTELDSDKDGIPDARERLGCTDPLNADTDGDGLNDGFEDRNGNHIVDDGETDPCNPDTDGDGIWDGDELNGSHHSNPLLVDTDGDGLPDGLEDANHNGD